MIPTAGADNAGINNRTRTILLPTGWFYEWNSYEDGRLHADVNRARRRPKTVSGTYENGLFSLFEVNYNFVSVKSIDLYDSIEL